MDFRYSDHNILNLFRDNNINDLIFAVGMYGAMADGTIKRMHNLGFNNGLVKKKLVLPVDSLINSEIKKIDTLNLEKKEIIKSE
jgi:GMP synthase PP-ATPase subunit